MRVASASIVSTDIDFLHHIQTGRHALDADAWRPMGGSDAAPSPFDLFLSSLGACTAITLRKLAQHEGWNLGKFRVELEMTHPSADKLRVRRVLHSDQPLSDKQWKRLLLVADYSPLTKSIRASVEISTERGS